MSRIAPIVRKKRPAVSESKLKKAQAALGTKSDAETVEKALDQVISDTERNRLAWAATERFVKSGITVRDVFGRVDEK